MLKIACDFRIPQTGQYERKRILSYVTVDFDTKILTNLKICERTCIDKTRNTTINCRGNIVNTELTKF